MYLKSDINSNMQLIKYLFLKGCFFVFAFTLTQPLLAQIILHDNAEDIVDTKSTMSQSGRKSNHENSKQNYFVNSGIIEAKSPTIYKSTLTITDKLYLPTNVQADINDNKEGVVTWDLPSATDFRYDSGEASTDIGYNNALNSILGSSHFENTVIEGVSWYTGDSEVHDSLSVVILGLYENKLPNLNDVLYWKKHANNNNSWTEIELDTLVTAPNGYFVGLQVEGFASVGVDSGEDEEWPFVYGVHLGIGDYESSSSSWNFLEDMGLMMNLMIRAKGYTVAENKGNESVQSYNVYRIDKATDISTEIATGISELNFLDTDIEQLTAGYYSYGVSAVYENDLVSDIAYSNEVANNLHTDFTINVSSSAGASVQGAYVTLVNQEEEEELKYGMVVPEDGVCIVPNVLMGTYNITVSMMYHFPGITENISVTEGASTGISLDLNLAAPVISDYIIADKSALLTWDAPKSEYFDDFESYDDFIIEFEPWTSINVDGGTVMTFYSVYYDNQSVPQAGTIYNRYETVPRVGNFPYSGDKYLAVFNAGPEVFDTDKWNIAPKVLVENGYEVSFQATGGNEYYSEEVFQVFVSTGNALPEEMVAVSPVITTPKGTSDWVKYSFDLSPFAGQEIHVGIQCTSYDQFYLCVDDFYIGPSEGNSSDLQVSYNAYLNDLETPVATGVLDAEYVFANLPLGTNVLGVQAVYPDGVSEISTQEIEIVTSVSNVKEISLSVYPNPAKELVNIESEQTIENIAIYSLLGEQVYSSAINSKGSIQINTADYKPGIYLVKVQCGLSISTEYITVIR